MLTSFFILTQWLPSVDQIGLPPLVLGCLHQLSSNGPFQGTNNGLHFGFLWQPPIFWLDLWLWLPLLVHYKYSNNGKKFSNLLFSVTRKWGEKTFLRERPRKQWRMWRQQKIWTNAFFTVQNVQNSSVEVLCTSQYESWYVQSVRILLDGWGTAPTLTPKSSRRRQSF